MDWLTEYKIPVGKTAKIVNDWLNDNLGGFFDLVSLVMEGLIDAILWCLQSPHPFVIIALFVALTWYLQRSWKVCVGVVLGFLFILNQGYWDETTESLTLILSACVVCMGIGVPIGIAAAHRPRLYTAMVPVLDLMQTLPTFVYLIPAIVFFGLGMVPGLIATVIFVLPAPIRLTYLGVASTPTALLEATALEGGTALCHAANYGWAEPDHHAVAVDGGDCGTCGRERFGRAGHSGAELGQHRFGL
jgi:glycine betaine/proline transport system permease protein